MPAAEPTGSTGPTVAPVLLSSLTTLRLGGPAPRFTSVSTVDELADALPDPCGGTDSSGGTDSTDGTAALIIGGGSNLVVADEGVSGPVIRVDIRGFTVAGAGHGTNTSSAKAAGRGDADRGALLTVGAGENWDDVVAEAVAAGLTGIETLSGIPGSAGATPIQNVGAYGTEIAAVLESVEVFDRDSRRRRTLRAAELALGYRTSSLRGTDTAVVTAVRLRLGREPRPVRYAELARVLGVELGTPVPASQVREAVLDLRRAKGMVLDPGDPDTRSAGSFFTNPVLDDRALASARAAIDARLGPGARAPAYPADGGTKLSAAWLIERAGFGRGFALPGSRVAVSSKHTLALTNRGGGTTAELLALATAIRDGVRAAFGITLQPEPILVGVRLEPPGR